ncbi:MAG: ABC transporter permease [Mycobacterium sp.]|uniref:ABC transporter permease n=1 Tax=Mycobacterium sp. TaxID=1785 RepID=UPI001EB18D15|nr:ABC transporter permease [Mycobacterium sp.]MBW0017980.1 ABC transporter permease [Mycobacterium sp.]
MSQVSSALFPRWRRTGRNWASAWNRAGEQIGFHIITLRYMPAAIFRYRDETLRVIAQMSLGVGALALVGGAVVIVLFLTSNTGVLVAVVGYSDLSSIGIEALEGFFSAYINPRLTAPLITAIGLAATVGAGATAQLGAMRINEEIDALEVMGVQSIAYLVSTRVVASIVIGLPLFCVGLIGGVETTRVLVLLAYEQSSGVYEHYFNTFLRPTDIVWAFIQVTLQGLTIMLIHTYYGFTASGGPAGVGEATGRAVRSSLIAATFVTLVAGLILYGRSGGFHLSG